MTTARSIVWRLLAAGCAAALLAGCGGEEAPEEAAAPETTAPATNQTSEPRERTAATNEPPAPDQSLSAAGFEIAVWDSDDAGEGRLEISKGGEVVYAVTGERFELGGPGPSAQRVGLGEDITGDGAANLIVELWTGGLACCVDYLIYELEGERPELLGRIAAQTGGRFEDFNGDGAMEVRVRDGAFLGWNATVEESPAPPVILQWDGLWYTPAPELMEAPAPTPEQLAAWQQVVESGEEWNEPGEFAPPPQLWGVALDLMYTGHPDLAMAFLHSAWNDATPGRDAFIRRLMERLDTSKYWPEIARAHDWSREAVVN